MGMQTVIPLSLILFVSLFSFYTMKLSLISIQPAFLIASFKKMDQSNLFTLYFSIQDRGPWTISRQESLQLFFTPIHI